MDMAGMQSSSSVKKVPEVSLLHCRMKLLQINKTLENIKYSYNEAVMHIVTLVRAC